MCYPGGGGSGHIASGPSDALPRLGGGPNLYIFTQGKIHFTVGLLVLTQDMRLRRACWREKKRGSTEHGVPPLQAPFQVLRGSTLLPRLAHSLGTLVQFVPREGRAPASVRVVRLERDGRRVR